jgi:hypothetical protein
LLKNPRETVDRMRNVVGRFPQYSEFNQALIFMQRPDATFFVGRGQWLQEHGRKVRPETQGLTILARKQKTCDPTAVVDPFVATWWKSHWLGLLLSRPKP